MNIPAQRLASQQISVHRFQNPEELLAWLGAIQAQDYAMAKWAIGCRLPDSTDLQVEKDFNEGRILRTHVLRPTWHFVSPKDIRWLLKLTAPKIKSFAKAHHAGLGIESKILRKSKKILEKTLAKNGPLARNEIQQVFLESGIKTNDSRLGFLLMDAELEGLVCSAGRKGKQFAYGLLEDIVREHTDLRGMEAATELARRYFAGHGPASIHDFAWWSGLPLVRIKEVLAQLKSELSSERREDRTYWFSGPGVTSGPISGRSYFLPAFDEYLIGYKHRDDLIDPASARKVLTANGIFNPVVLKKGRVIATWKKQEQPSGLLIKLSAFADAGAVRDRGLLAAVREYSRFMGLTAAIEPAPR